MGHHSSAPVVHNAAALDRLFHLDPTKISVLASDEPACGRSASMTQVALEMIVESFTWPKQTST